VTILLDAERSDTESLVPALLHAADAHETGELSAALPDNGFAQVFLREGRVYGVAVRDGSRTLGELLVTGGYLTVEQLDYALQAQRDDLPSWRIGELLVHLGYVTPQQVQDCLGEQMTEMLGWLLAQPDIRWHLRRGSRTRWAFAPPMDVPWLLDTLGVRHTTPSAEKLAALLEPLAAVEPAYTKAPEKAARAEKAQAEKGNAAEPADVPDEEPAPPVGTDAGSDDADEGMVRSDALAAISDLNADLEADDEDPGQRGRRIMGLLFASGAGKDGGGGKRGKGKRRTA
jgi:hypothetical protein